MDFVIGLLAELITAGLWLFAKPEQRQSDRRRRATRLCLREQAAWQLDGVYRKPWFRSPRIEGQCDGRPLEIRWPGRGQVEVRCKARSWIEVRGRHRSGPLRWLLGSGPRFSGVSVRRLNGQLRDLFREHGLSSLRVENGQLVARAPDPVNDEQLTAMALSLSRLAWPRLQPQPMPIPPKPVVTARPAATAHRCPFCHDDLSPAGVVVHCAGCEAPHHPSCFEEGDGCSIAGCSERRARGRRTVGV